MIEPRTRTKYLYDRFGNRWQQNGPYTFTASFTGNNPANPQNNNRIDGYSYDAAGNMTSDGFHSYTYDAENHLVLVDNGNTARYGYDAEGRRVSDTKDGSYLYDLEGHPFDLITGGLRRGEYYAPGRHVGTYNNNTTYFNLTDWLGTERVRTTISGTLCETCTNLPFGDILSCTGSDPTPMHFTGKEHDNETGLDNFGARYLTSSMGRFMSPDPLLSSGRPWEPQSWNRYAYARNNPLNITDPTGLYDLVNNCAANDTNCVKHFRRNAEDLKKGLADLQKKVNKMKDGSDKQRLQAALTAFGTEGDHNGVNATFGAVANGAAETTFGYNDQTNQVTANGTFDPGKISGSNDYANKRRSRRHAYR